MRKSKRMRNLKEHVLAISSTRMYQYAGMSEENDHLGCAQDVFVMDTSLAEPIKFDAFHRIGAAEQCLAEDDFVIDDPASHDDVSAFTVNDPAEQRGDIQQILMTSMKTVFSCRSDRRHQKGTAPPHTKSQASRRLSTFARRL